ncbi:MAG: Mur ligase family protein, partial [bacterium]|nr:Mur ligase family protein [bacterium]
MTFKEAVATVQRFAAATSSVDSFDDLPKKLPRMEYFLSLLGNPHKQYKTIHVGGTSGKGSTAAMIASILQASGYRVGLHTQPYLERFTEKISINGEPIDDALFVELVQTLMQTVEKLKKSEYGLGAGFYFQLSTALAFQAFADASVDYGVIEVGVGGEFDSTNVIVPEVSVLTNVSLDHTQFLGDTVEKIAATKAGIIKPGIPVVSAATQRSVRSILRKKAASMRAPLFFYGKDFSDPQCPVRMLGRHQRVNASCAVMAVKLLKHQIDEAAIKKGLASAFLPGRFEIVR